MLWRITPRYRRRNDNRLVVRKDGFQREAHLLQACARLSDEVSTNRVSRMDQTVKLRQIVPLTTDRVVLTAQRSLKEFSE